MIQPTIFKLNHGCTYKLDTKEKKQITFLACPNLILTLTKIYLSNLTEILIYFSIKLNKRTNDT